MATNEPPEPPPATFVIRLVVLSAAFVGTHVAAAAAGGRFWGLHVLRYLDAAQIAGVAAGAALVGLVFAKGAPAPGAPAHGRRGAARALVAIGLFLVLAVALRDRSHLLGDGTVILDPANAAAPPAEREPGSHLVDAVLHRAAARFGVPPARAFEAWSIFCGVGMLLLLLRADRHARAGNWAFLLAVTTGAAQLFFGYVEHYPAVALTWMACMVALTPAFERRASLLPASLAFAAGLLLHIATVILAPVFLWALVRQLALRRGAGRLRPVAEAAAGGLAFLAAWHFLLGGHGKSWIDYLGLLRQTGRFVDAGGDSALAAPLVSVQRMVDVLHLQTLLVPVALPLLALGVVRVARSRHAPTAADLGWAIAAASFLGAQVLFSPALGAPRDWDVLAAGAFPVAILAARLTAGVFAPRVRAVLVALAAFHTLTWIAVNATPPAAQARFAEIPLPPGQNDFVLGTQALKRGDVDEAIRRFEAVVQRVPQTCPGTFSLGLAYESAGRFDAAREAFGRALANSERDPRVPSADILERLGRAAWRTGREDEARAAFTRARELRPASLPAVVFLAVLAGRDGKPDEVLRLLDPFLPRRAEQPSILMLTADALDALGRTDEANARRDEAARLFPDDSNVRAARERRPAETAP